MLGVIIVLHILVCVFLIFIILIQPGKGYGLSETFGGQTQSIFGVRAGTLLTRITAISAFLFLIASLGIAIYSGKRSRSLMERVMKEEKKKVTTEKETPMPLSEPLERGTPTPTQESSPLPQ